VADWQQEPTILQHRLGRWRGRSIFRASRTWNLHRSDQQFRSRL